MSQLELRHVSRMLYYPASYIPVLISSDECSPLPFTPFTILLGNLVKEVHRHLLELLTQESQYLVLIQVLKVTDSGLHPLTHHIYVCM